MQTKGVVRWKMGIHKRAGLCFPEDCLECKHCVWPWGVTACSYNNHWALIGWENPQYHKICPDSTGIFLMLRYQLGIPAWWEEDDSSHIAMSFTLTSQARWPGVSCRGQWRLHWKIHCSPQPGSTRSCSHTALLQAISHHCWKRLCSRHILVATSFPCVVLARSAGVHDKSNTMVHLSISNRHGKVLQK